MRYVINSQYLNLLHMQINYIILIGISLILLRIDLLEIIIPDISFLFWPFWLKIYLKFN